MKEGVFKSLEPPAARDVRHLGERVMVASIPKKLEEMYGTVTALYALMQNFY